MDSNPNQNFSTNPPSPTTTTSMNSAQDIEQLTNRIKSDAGWFFWIAGLSLINSIVFFSGGDWAFIVGLTATQVIDEIAKELKANLVIPFLFDMIIVGIYILLGAFARKRYVWAFITGAVFYILDSLLLFIVMDIKSLLFHALALFFIFRGLISRNKQKKLQQQYTPYLAA